MALLADGIKNARSAPAAPVVSPPAVQILDMACEAENPPSQPCEPTCFGV